MEEKIQRLFAKSFKGRLYAMATNKKIPLRRSTSRDKWDWGFQPQNDWLMAGGDLSSIMLDFSFDSETEDRLHYHIRLAGLPHKLGLSLNNYLGFYLHAQVTDYWKIEPLELTEDGLICYLRDHEGYRVGAIKDTPHRSGHPMYLLNTKDGETITFLLQQRA